MNSSVIDAAEPGGHSRSVDVGHVIATVLKIDPAELDDSLAYQSISEWDSLRHVQLMLSLEQALKVRITGEQRVRLSSVGAIREFACSLHGQQLLSPVPSSRAKLQPRPIIHRGLEGVVLDQTCISRIDADAGVLEYRGYSISDLVDYSTAEETAYLLFHGELPESDQRRSFESELTAARASVPPMVIELMRSLAGVHPMEALRSGMSMLGTLDPESLDQSPGATLRKGQRLVGQVPTLIAAHHAGRCNRELPTIDAQQSHAAHLLQMVRGEEPSPFDVDLVNRVLIIHADHSCNASTTAARVAMGCRAGVHAAVTAAVATFAGELHGGAAERVAEMITRIGAPEKAGAYVRACFDTQVPVMGFGHRVYKTEDPRVAPLRDSALRASRQRGDLRSYDVVEALVEEMKPYARHGVAANVDLYVGVIYQMLGLPSDLAVPMFVAGRIVGWVAQALEQQANNVLIRPLLHYVGPATRTHPKATARQ